MNLVSVVQLSLQAQWFALEADRRQAMRRQAFEVLTRHPDIESRWFGADPWAGNGLEFLTCEFSSLHAYWAFWNELREQPMFRPPIVEIVRVSLGYERSLTRGLVDT